MEGEDSFENKEEHKQGYIRNKVDPNGDCGYTAFGITREDALQLLKDNVNAIRDILKPAVQEALYRREFYNYLIENKYVDSHVTYEDIEENVKGFKTHLNVLQGYLYYDVRDRRIDAGWAHPCVLQALAHIQNIELRLWQLGEAEELVPLKVHDQDYSSYRPPNVKDRTDLLFVKKNHFERLQFQGYENELPGEGEKVYPVSHLQDQDDELEHEKNSKDEESESDDDLRVKLTRSDPLKFETLKVTHKNTAKLFIEGKAGKDVFSPRSVSPQSQSIYLAVDDGKSPYGTDDIELIVGMPKNSVRVLIWDPPLSKTTVATRCFSLFLGTLLGCQGACENMDSGSDTNTGHMAMIIKDKQGQHIHVSLYHKKQISYKDKWCCSDANLFISYYGRHKKSIIGNNVPDYRYSYKSKSGSNHSIQLQCDGKRYFKDEHGNIRKRHPDYVIEIQFDENGIDEMKRYYFEYVENDPKWRFLGNNCFWPRRYQNCNSLCYNLLAKGGVFTLLPFPFDRLAYYTKRAAEFIKPFISAGVLWGIIHALDCILNGQDNFFKCFFKDEGLFTNLEEGGAVFIYFLFRIRFLIPATLSCLFQGAGICLSDQQVFLSPIEFKKYLIKAATHSSGDGVSKVKLVHTSDTLDKVVVVVPNQSSSKSEKSEQEDSSKTGTASPGGGEGETVPLVGSHHTRGCTLV